MRHGVTRDRLHDAENHEAGRGGGPAPAPPPPRARHRAPSCRYGPQIVTSMYFDRHNIQRSQRRLYNCLFLLESTYQGGAQLFLLSKVLCFQEGEGAFSEYCTGGNIHCWVLLRNVGLNSANINVTSGQGPDAGMQHSLHGAQLAKRKTRQI